MKFCPTPENFNSKISTKDMNDFCGIFLEFFGMEFFDGLTGNDESIVKPKSYFNPPDGRNTAIDRSTMVLKKPLPC